MPDGRWLNADEAAAYLSLSVEGFRRKVRAGVVPKPSRVLGAVLPRCDLAAMTGGIASSNPIEAAEAFTHGLATKLRARNPRGSG